MRSILAQDADKVNIISLKVLITCMPEFPICRAL